MCVSTEILTTIKELQGLETLSEFYLAGGTNLAIRYSHRESIDIDLFCEDIIGISGFENIETEMREYFGDRILSIIYPTRQSDELVFLQSIITTNGENIKVEIIQGFWLSEPVENIDGMRLASEKDIGLFKLDSLSNRYAEKDLYDLDYITDRPKLSLDNLMTAYLERKEYYNNTGINSIFSLSNEVCPLENPEKLLLLERQAPNIKGIPFHLESRIKNGKTSMTYHTSNWKLKVRSYIKKNPTL